MHWLVNFRQFAISTRQSVATSTRSKIEVLFKSKLVSGNVVRSCGIKGGRESNTPYEYDKLHQTVQLDDPEHFNFARDIVLRWADKKSSHPALFMVAENSEYALTYSKLIEESAQLATGLKRCFRKVVGAERGKEPPKVALVFLPKIPEWWVTNVAASWAGIIVSPGTTMLTAADVKYRVSQCHAECVICDEVTAARIDAVTQDVPLRVVVTQTKTPGRPGWLSYEEVMWAGVGCGTSKDEQCADTRAEDVAQLFFTSGTTGKAKMVPHTQAGFGVGHVITAKYWLDISEDDIMWNIADTGWAKTAWSSLYAPFIAGATSFQHQMDRFSAIEVLNTLQNHGVSIMCAPPTAYRALVQENIQEKPPRALRHCVSAGEPLNPEVMTAWSSATGLNIYEGYGQTEVTLPLATLRGMEVRPGSMGKAMPPYNLQVLDDDGNEVENGVEGEIAIDLRYKRPIGLFPGYYRDDAKTAQVLKEGRFYLTGDRGFRDADGYYWFVGRSDDVIISAGYRIGPFEVESALLEHPAVAESAVIGVPDQYRGQIVKAYVVLAEAYGKTKDIEKITKELQNHVKNTTAPYKYPRQIEFVEVLPKTISGKIRRVELRDKHK